MTKWFSSPGTLMGSLCSALLCSALRCSAPNLFDFPSPPHFDFR